MTTLRVMNMMPMATISSEEVGLRSVGKGIWKSIVVKPGQASGRDTLETCRTSAPTPAPCLGDGKT